MDSPPLNERNSTRPQKTFLRTKNSPNSSGGRTPCIVSTQKSNGHDEISFSHIFEKKPWICSVSVPPVLYKQGSTFRSSRSQLLAK